SIYLLRPPSIIAPFPYTTLFRSAPGITTTVIFVGGNAKENNRLNTFAPGMLHSVSQLGFGVAKHTGHARDGNRPADALFHKNGRSEEHTSELQSRENLVCRLLLE